MDKEEAPPLSSDGFWINDNNRRTLDAQRQDYSNPMRL